MCQKLFTSLILWLTSLAAAQATLPENLFPQLQIYLTEALQAAPEVQRQRLLLREAAGYAQAAASARLPQVNANGRLALRAENRFGNESDFDRFTGLGDTNLTMRQPLYHFGGVEAQVEQGRLQENLAQAEAERVRQELMQNIRRHYLNWLLARLEMHSVEAHHTSAEAYAQNFRALHATGDASEQALLEAEIALEDFTAWQLHLERSALYERQALEDLLGRPLPVDEPLPESFPEVDISAHLTRNTTSTLPHDVSTPELEKTRVELKLEQSRYQHLQSQSLPRLDLVAGLYQDSVDDYRSTSGGGLEANSIPRLQSFFGLQVSWDIFDGFRRDGLKASSLAKQERLELEIAEHSEREVRRQEQMQRDLVHLAQQVRARERRTSLQTQKVAALKQMTDDDMAAQSELLSAEATLAQQRVLYWRAQAEYLLQNAAYETRYGALANTSPLHP